MTDTLVHELDLAEASRALKRDIGFTGGYLGNFEAIGRHSFETAQAVGLKPTHKFLDFGAGALRLGYWFVRYLDAGNYYAIERRRDRLEGGKRHMFGPDILREKFPTFYVSDKCDMTRLGVPFDFVIARSILSHTHPGMLRLILDEFSKCTAPNGVFLASYWDLDRMKRKVGESGDDMPRDDTAFGGTVKFSLPYLKDGASEYGLVAEAFPTTEIFNRQVWVTFRATAKDEEPVSTLPSD